MQQNEHGKLTIRVNGKYIEVEDKNGRVATARCNPVDKFDIYVGIGIALQRLKEEQIKQLKEEERKCFRPFVCGNCFSPHGLNEFEGYIGDKTDLKDEFGKELLVGDTVKIKEKNDQKIFISTVFKNSVSDGIMGFPSIIQGQSPIGRYNREDLVIVKLPRQKKTSWCTLIETYEEIENMKGK